jgi:hypothetical protein
VKLITHIYLMPKSRMGEAIPPLPNTPSWRGAQFKKKHKEILSLPFTFIQQHKFPECSRRLPKLLVHEDDCSYLGFTHTHTHTHTHMNNFKRTVSLRNQIKLTMIRFVQISITFIYSRKALMIRLSNKCTLNRLKMPF